MRFNLQYHNIDRKNDIRKLFRNPKIGMFHLKKKKKSIRYCKSILFFRYNKNYICTSYTICELVIYIYIYIQRDATQPKRSMY